MSKEANATIYISLLTELQQSPTDVVYKHFIPTGFVMLKRLTKESWNFATTRSQTYTNFSALSPWVQSSLSI
jgi:hypothetical protein